MMAKAKTISRKKYDELKQWYAEELERKDQRIEQLKTHNELLVKSSLKTSERLAILQETRK